MNMNDGEFLESYDFKRRACAQKVREKWLCYADLIRTCLPYRELRAQKRDKMCRSAVKLISAQIGWNKIIQERRKSLRHS